MGQGKRLLPRAGELIALFRAGLAERNRVDLAAGGAWWWRGLGWLAVPLNCPGFFHARAAVVAVAILVTTAPAVFWHLSAGLRIEQLGGGLTSATRDVVPGLIAVGCMVVAASLAAAFARRTVRIERESLSR